MAPRTLICLTALCALACLAQAGIPIPSTMDGFVIGSPTASVQFELFGDTMCPDTKAAYPTIRAVAANYGPDRLRLVFHALSLPFTHTSWLTNLGLWVVAASNPKNAYPYIELIFDNQDSYWNHVTHGNTTDEIVSSIGALTEAKGLMAQTDFVAGMNNATLSFLASSSWKYIVTRGVASTPTFFVNGVTVDADPSWTASDWESVLDPLYGLSRAPTKPTCREIVDQIQTQSNNTCPTGDSPCQYLPGKWQCCKPGIYCVPNVGCECSRPLEPEDCKKTIATIQTQSNNTCPSGDSPCQYLPGKWQCCKPGIYCVPNVGCECSAPAPAPSECTARTLMPVSSDNSTCPAHETACEYLPNKYQCCFPGEFCIKNVGCSCMEDAEPAPCVQRDEPAATSSNSTCPANMTACEYLPGKYQCCYPGDFCIRDEGCTCADSQPVAPAACGRELMPVSSDNSTCPAHETACEYLPNKYQCCFPGEFCIKNVGCSCMEDAEPVECAAREEPAVTTSNSTCPDHETACEYLPNKYQCCFPGEFCIKNVGCSCMDDEPAAPAACARELMPVSSDNSTCPAHETACEYLPNKYQCCFPGEFCIKNVGCSCMEDAEPVECAAREDPAVTTANSTCPDHEAACEYLPNKYQCCFPGEFCIKNVGCSCMDDESEPEPAPAPLCAPRAEPPRTTANSTCPDHETACEYLPNKYQCCFPGEFCIKNVGCSCMEDESQQPSIVIDDSEAEPEPELM